MSKPPDRRGSPRFPIAGRLAARAHATLDVQLLDLSMTGARVEHVDLLRPGFSYSLELQSALGAVVLPVRIVHSTVVGTDPIAEGQRRLRYQSGLEFVSLTADQEAALAGIVERLNPGGSLGDGRVLL